MPGPGGNRGVFMAWDPVAAKGVWGIKEKFPVWSGTVVTAGDVVFYGTMDGWFKATDAKTGDELWQFKCGSGIIGQPIVYRGPDGREYVAVLLGSGRLGRSDRQQRQLDPRDATAGNGLGHHDGRLEGGQHSRGNAVPQVFSIGGAFGAKPFSDSTQVCNFAWGIKSMPSQFDGVGTRRGKANQL